MSIRNNIWYDFVNSKYGDEYLDLYIGRQRWIRKLFRIFTIVLSGSAFATALQDLKVSTAIFSGLILLSQGITSIENFIIHSEDDITKLCDLRLQYYKNTVMLEQLWHNLETKNIDETEAARLYFLSKSDTSILQELSNKVNVRKYKGLKAKSDIIIRNYINTYYA